MSSIRKLGALAALSLLGACAVQGPRLAPLTDISSRECAAGPDLTKAAPLAFDGKKESEQSADIGGAALCMKSDGGQALYTAYALPPGDVPYVLSVASAAQGSTIFVPHVMLLAGDGTLRRQFAGDAAVFRGNGLSITLRSHADEAYLVVASDPAMVGKTEARIEEATQVTTASTGYATYQIHTGSESHPTYTFAHNGRVTITLTPLPAK